MKTINILVLCTLIMLCSCGSKQQENQHATADMAVAKMEMAPPLMEESSLLESKVKADGEIPDEFALKQSYEDPNTSKHLKKIIKDGNMTIEATEIQKSKQHMDQLIKQLGGYYEREDLRNNDQEYAYNLQVRVPSGNFEKLIEQIEQGTDEIKSKTIEARDVTEEYVDIETRLANKREYLKRYKEILGKASTVKDILAIEENIRIIEEEIESKEGRLKYLSDQVNFSTLQIHLYTEKAFIYKPQPQDPFAERLKKSLNSGLTTIVDGVLWIIAVWPCLLIMTLIGYFVRQGIKKRKNG